MERGLSVKGLIYDCQHLSSIDVTALEKVKELIEIVCN